MLLLDNMNQDENEDFDFKEWQKRRKRTLIGFYLEAVCLGMEYSLTFITLWLYLDDVMKVKNTKFFYSIISAAYLFSQVVSSVIFSRVVDKYRNVSMMFFIGNMLVIVGNILYILPYTPWLLFTGRLISGGGGCLRAIMTSEIVRSYPQEELCGKFSFMGMAFALGFILGPGINFFFLNIDVTAFGVPIKYANAPGMYLAVIFMIMLIISAILTSDLSKEYDLKENLLRSENERLLAEHSPELELQALFDDYEQQEEPTALQIVVKVVSQLDTCVLVIFSFGFMYCMVLFDLWQPLAVVQLVHWGVFEINIIIFGYGVVSVMLLLLLTLRPLSDKNTVYLSWVCTLSVAGICLIFLVIKLYSSYSKYLNIALWVCYAILFSIIVIMEEVFLMGTMARMTHSTVQGFTESIRLGFSRIGALFALLSAAVLFDYIVQVTISLSIVCLVGLVVLMGRVESFSNPKVIIK